MNKPSDYQSSFDFVREKMEEERLKGKIEVLHEMCINLDKISKLTGKTLEEIKKITKELDNE